MMSMNSGKIYEWDKKKYEVMNIKIEVNMMKAVIIKQLLKEYTIISNKHNHNNSNNDN